MFKIFGYFHTYGQNATSGADKMAQSLLEYLAQRGCTVQVGVKDCSPYVLNGVMVQSNGIMLAEKFEQADIIFTHLTHANPALEIARRFSKPVVSLAHNPEMRTNEGYVVYNSESLRDELKMALPGIVVNPPTYLKDWQNDIDHYHAKYITLVNCCHNKGAEVLKSLAQWMPQYKFLGVYGGYGKQLPYSGTPNLTFRAFSNKMDYSDTRILIVPSKKESWSLCAAEAMASGIPVICSDLPGLRENCGEAAIYCGSVGEFKTAIDALSSVPEYYAMAERGEWLMKHRQNLHEQQLNNLYNFISEIVNKDKYISGYVKVEKWMMKDIGEIEMEQTEKELIKLRKEKKVIKPKKEKKELHGSPYK